MTQLLQTAITAAQQLPSDAQNDLALAILAHINKTKKEPRPLGFAQGMGTVADDFNAVLPPDEEGLWYQNHQGDPLS